MVVQVTQATQLMILKICDIECYAPSDNISELTARTNDDGFENIFSII